MRFALVPLVILTLIWAPLGYVLAPRLPGGWGGVVALAVLFTPVPLTALLRLRSARHYPGRLFRLLVLRPFWYLQLLLLLLGPVVALGILVGLVTGDARLGGSIALVSTVGVFAIGMLLGYAGSRRLRVRRLTVQHPALPEALDGLRIVQLSDLHVGPHTSRRHLARVREATAAARPDLIVVTGDLVDDHSGDVAVYEQTLGALAAPLGVFAVAGNHDVYAGWPAVRAALERLPLTVLVNESRTLRHRGAELVVAGTGDPAGGRGGTATGGPDLRATLADVPPGAFLVVLAHNPALWPPLAKAGVPLTLSGHTHWGQLAIPAIGWSLASPFLDHAMGSYEEDGRLLYIHPGTNYWGIPFRLGTPAEVAVLELRRGEAEVVEG